MWSNLCMYICLFWGGLFFGLCAVPRCETLSKLQDNERFPLLGMYHCEGESARAPFLSRRFIFGRLLFPSLWQVNGSLWSTKCAPAAVNAQTHRFCVCSARGGWQRWSGLPMCSVESTLNRFLWVCLFVLFTYSPAVFRLYPAGPTDILG